MTPATPELPAQPSPATPPRTAFVLGGGGILGATQIGMLEALLQRGIHPDVIIGTSVGALNGAFLAARPTLEGVQRMSVMWQRIAGGRSKHFVQTPSEHVANWKRTRTLINHWAIASIVEEHLGGRGITEFQQLQVPFQCVAAHIEKASSTWFDSGLIAPAVAASCAVPGLFPPVRIDGEHYYDGGLVHSIPVSRAWELGATQIYVLQVGRVESPLRSPRWPWEVGMVAFEIARRHRYYDEIKAAPPGVSVHVLPSGAENTPAMMSMGLARADRIAQRIEQAHEATGSYLDEAPEHQPLPPHTDASR